jgi:phosphatidate phosphatase APP1
MVSKDRKDWKSRLEGVIGSMDNLSDSVRFRLREITGFDNPLMIVPYLGYGTSDKLLLNGRVLEDEGFTLSGDVHATWQNLVNVFRRFETDEVPGARIRVIFQGVATEIIADQEGYFTAEIHPVKPLDSRAWQEVELELLDPPSRDGRRVRTMVQVLVPPQSARFGTISDVDDTVLSTNVTNKLKMILTVTLLNEHTRKPFNGVAALYRALQKGPSGSEQNPIFYVSNSPWNLYTLLVEFLRVQDIPIGPLLLRDFGDHLLFPSKDHHGHKMSNICRILETFPKLPFILIGDSGEQDPEIYREVVKNYPNRIRAIYIRSIDRQPSRLAAIDQLIEEVQRTGSQLVLAPDSEFAAVHAAAEGLISTSVLPTIRLEKQKDTTAPSQKEVATLNIG